MSEPQVRTLYTTLADPRVGSLVLQGYLDLVARKLHNGRFDLSPAKQVVLVEASIDGGRDWEPAAVAMYLFSQEQRMLWLDLLYVLEAWRGRGLGKNIFGALAKVARDSGMLSLEYGTAVNNTSMRSVAKRLGHTEIAIMVSVPIEET